ncbi:enoyl-CoA hydratase-related protein [Streptomyces sp. NPDC059740]|uniref:enoyl-CoA hydratase-related protein n=1 Tax=Streptomyces sp. NPDC059740 TaxID=3346926 RepID=UPI0036674203
MRILLIADSFNSLTQRVQAELRQGSHTTAFARVTDEESVRAAVRHHRPELVVAPMLTRRVPQDVWSAHTVLIVHPGPPGDRGPSSLDRAVQAGRTEWGVTVLQADAEMDAGPVWADVRFPVPPVGKSDLYRGEVADAAVEAVLLAVARFASATWTPRSQQDLEPVVAPLLRQSERRIDWHRDPTATVLRKLRAADSQPGVLDTWLGAEWHLHGGHPEDRLRGEPGALVATRCQAVCRATADGAVWIPQLRPRRRPGGPTTYTLPATLALADRLPTVPEVPAPPATEDGAHTYRDVHYRESGGAGFLHFTFPGGAMSTEQCERLLAAYRYACTRPTRVLVLGGPRDFFSNGIHLNVIEAAAHPAREAWRNIQAIDDLVEAVLTTTDRLVVAALAGNAAAGGVMLAAAADEVWCRDGAVLNPHYRLMGLPGSEYWTYSLPRRVGAETAHTLLGAAEPVTAGAARDLGLVDRVVASPVGDFAEEVRAMAVELAEDASLGRRLTEKKVRRAAEESRRPLRAYRDEELAAMRAVFDDPSAAFHTLRSAFVHKTPAT